MDSESSAAGRKRRRHRQRLALFAAAAGLCAVALPLGAEAILYYRTGQSWLLVNRGDRGHNQYDPLLGWTSRPSSDWPDLYGPGIGASYNSRGFLGAEEDEPSKPAGRTRILFLGDSFTEGVGVRAAETYPAQMERLVPRIQAVNLGKSSYGIDQAILRYERDASSMEADMVVLALIDNDLVRCRSDRFLGFWPKPRFELLPDGEIRLTGVPVPDFSVSARNVQQIMQRSALFLLPRQFYWHIASPNKDEKLAAALFSYLRKILSRRGQRLALVYLPTQGELLGDPLPLAGMMRRYADEQGVQFVDLTAALGSLERPELLECFLANGHYTTAGHRRVAEELLHALELHPPAATKLP